MNLRRCNLQSRDVAQPKKSHTAGQAIDARVRTTGEAAKLSVVDVQVLGILVVAILGMFPNF